MRNIVLSTALAIGAFFGSGPSQAFGIAIHAPGDGATDAEHIALAAQPEFQASGWINFSSNGDSSPLGSATLVSPNWVVTSQSNVNVSGGTTPLPAANLKIGFGSNSLTDSTMYSVVQMIRMPGYSPTTGANDLVFLRLDTPVTGITPVSLFTGTLSLGQKVTTIGHGQPGSAANGLLPYDGIERGMINQVASEEDLMSNYPEASSAMVMTYIMPDNSYGYYEYLGGAITPGDGGGSLMVLDNGEWKLAGVTAYEYGSPSYYTGSVYTQIAPYYSWISSQPALVSIIVPEPGAFSLVLASAFGFLTRRTRTKR